MGDFEDWEPVARPRKVHYVWPNGNPLSLAEENWLDDYIIFVPSSKPGPAGDVHQHELRNQLRP